MCSHPSHFRLPALKVFAAQLLFHDLEPRLNGLNYESVNRIAGHLAYLSRQLSIQTESAHNENLGDALRKTSRKLSVIASAPGAQCLDDYSDAVNQIDCVKCSGPLPPCKNSWRDSEIVHAGGQCIQPLKDLFNAIARFSREWYGEHLTDKQWPTYDLELSTGPPPAGSRVHDFDVPYRVGGEVCIHGSRTYVRLILRPEEFDRNTYRACLYVLFHEIICHGFQGLVSSGAEGERVAFAVDEFAEGWMDWVALLALETFLDDPPENCAAVHIRDAEDTRAIAHEFHMKRHSPSHPHENTKTYLDGVRTAKDTQRFIEDMVLLGCASPHDPPDEEFLRLSVDLNVTRSTISERQQFMQRLRIATESLYDSGLHEDEIQALLTHGRLTGVFRQYLERQKDVRGLIGDVLSMKTVPFFD